MQYFCGRIHHARSRLDTVLYKGGKVGLWLRSKFFRTLGCFDVDPAPSFLAQAGVRESNSMWMGVLHTLLLRLFSHMKESSKERLHKLRCESRTETRMSRTA